MWFIYTERNKVPGSITQVGPKVEPLSDSITLILLLSTFYKF